MMDFRRGRKREDPEINLIPFIDVLLVVLIFLMVSTTYSNVTVDAKGNYTVNNTPVAFTSVAGLAQDMRTAARTPDGQVVASPVVIVNADQFAMHQMVINVLEAARVAGYDKLTFAAQTGTGK
jgi:biopolymer transport protein ExbD